MKIKTEEELLREHIEKCHTQDSYDYGYYKDEIPKVPNYSGGGSGSGSSVSGSCVLEKDITANITVGGITTVTTLPKGTTFTEAMEKLLVKYVEPTISVNSSNTITEKWNPFSDGTTLSITATAGDGSATIQKVEIFKDSSTTPLTSYTYSDTSVATPSFSYTSEINTTTTFKVKVTDTNNHIATASTTVNVVLPYYYGVNALNTIEDVSGFTSITDVKKAQAVTYTPEVEYIYFAFDGSYTLKDIVDTQGESCKSSFNNKTITITKNGKDYTYTMYISKLVAKSTNYKLTFSFN